MMRQKLGLFTAVTFVEGDLLNVACIVNLSETASQHFSGLAWLLPLEPLTVGHCLPVKWSVITFYAINNNSFVRASYDKVS